MNRTLAFLLACLLAASAHEGTALKDTKDCWGDPVYLRVADDLLYMTMDNWPPYQPVAVKEGFVEAVRALEESGEREYLDPDGMDRELMALLDDSLTGGAKVVDIDVQAEQIFLFLEGPGDGYTLRIAEWNGAGYDVLDNPTFPANSEMDNIHCERGMLIWINVSEMSGWAVYAYRSEEDGWKMGVRTDISFWDFEWRWQAIVDPNAVRQGSNDGYYYGDDPFELDFEAFDVAGFPAPMEEMVARMDRSGWAVVNNPNPEDRLPLRVSPDGEAELLGEFYNRTPVRIVGAQGEWSQVVIGEEEGLTGWMTSECLAFGETMDGVACAFPRIKEEQGTRHPVWNVPDANERVQWRASYEDDCIIGVLGDEWYIVMTPWTGWIGYAQIQ